VLVVDDEPDAREVMAHALQARGARVVRAASAPEAFDLLGHGEFDVLLTDIAMPEEDGHAFIRRVRASSDRRMARIPAAAVTAHAGRSEREQALAAGFQCHLAKPVEAVTLARTVDHLLHGRVTARPEAKPLHLH
jgi:CheY-like chemotaxis protein